MSHPLRKRTINTGSPSVTTSDLDQVKCNDPLFELVRKPPTKFEKIANAFNRWRQITLAHLQCGTAKVAQYLGLRHTNQMDEIVDISNTFFHRQKQRAMTLFTIMVVVLCVYFVAKYGFLAYAHYNLLAQYQYQHGSRMIYISPHMVKSSVFHSLSEIPPHFYCACHMIEEDEMKTNRIQIYNASANDPLSVKTPIANLPLSNILQINEQLLHDTSEIELAFVVPKLWNLTDPDINTWMSEMEFNPCLLSMRLSNNQILHMLNPVSVIHHMAAVESKALPPPDRVVWDHPAAFEFTSTGIRSERYKSIKINFIEPQHTNQMQKTVHIFEGQDAFVIQSALDVLNDGYKKKFMTAGIHAKARIRIVEYDANGVRADS